MEEINRHHIIPNERRREVDPWTHVIFNPVDGAIIVEQNYIVRQAILLNQQNVQRLIDIVHQLQNGGGVNRG